MIAIINYGSGNVQAIANIYHRLGIEHKISNLPSDIEAADHLILPGVGAFDTVMGALVSSGLIPLLNEQVLQKEIPVLGVCVGMQILADASEEGKLPGLGWISGKVKKMSVTSLIHKPHLPHMGWNNVTPVVNHPLMEGIDHDLGFYFLHSYCFVCQAESNRLTSTHYGAEFTSAVYRNNIFGTQFHPEKSHSNGIRIFQNFAEIY